MAALCDPVCARAERLAAEFGVAGAFPSAREMTKALDSSVGYALLP